MSENWWRVIFRQCMEGHQSSAGVLQVDFLLVVKLHKVSDQDTENKSFSVIILSNTLIRVDVHPEVPRML